MVVPRGYAVVRVDTRLGTDYNNGRNTLYTGGESPSHLLLPVIP